MSYKDTFDFVRELGRGGSATAYLVIEKSTGQRYTLKCLHPTFAGDTAAIKRLRREYQILASLQSSRMVRISRSFLENDPPALLIDYVDGCNLDQFRHKLPFVLPEMALEIIWHTLLSLREAHATDITHRDIKPSNILVHHDGRIILSDFGLATVTGSTRVTSQSSFLGTIDYLSPEQVRGDSISASADIFSVGVVLYQLVTGTLPFTRVGVPATLNAILNEAPERPERRNPKVSQRLSGLVLKAIEKPLDRRYQTVDEFIAAIERYFSTIGYPYSGDKLTWLDNPSDFVMDLLSHCAGELTRNAERSLQADDFDGFMQDLVHLQLKAPQAAAIGRLLEGYDRKKRAIKNRRLSLAFASIFILAVGYFVQRNHQPERVVPILATGPIMTTAPVTKVEPNSTKKDPIVTPEKRRGAANTGTIHFNVDEFTQIFLDGKKVKSMKMQGVTLGSHWLLLDRDGYDPIRAQIVVKAGSPTVINLKD